MPEGMVVPFEMHNGQQIYLWRGDPPSGPDSGKLFASAPSFTVFPGLKKVDGKLPMYAGANFGASTEEVYAFIGCIDSVAYTATSHAVSVVESFAGNGVFGYYPDFSIDLATKYGRTEKGMAVRCTWQQAHEWAIGVGYSLVKVPVSAPIYGGESIEYNVLIILDDSHYGDDGLHFTQHPRRDEFAAF